MASPTQGSPVRRPHSVWQRIREKLIEFLLVGCGLLSIIVTAAIAIVLLYNAFVFFTYKDRDFDSRAEAAVNASTIASLAGPLDSPYQRIFQISSSIKMPKAKSRSSTKLQEKVERTIDATAYGFAMSQSASVLIPLQQGEEIGKALTKKLVKAAQSREKSAQRQRESVQIFRQGRMKSSILIYAQKNEAYPLLEPMSAGEIWGRIREFFTGTEWTAGFADPEYGILPLVTGTLMVALIAALISIPIGLITAIYLSEYARPRVRGIAKPTLELLAGIPTVVYGFFALMTVTPFLQSIIPDLEFYNQLSGGIVVGIMIIPMVASLSEDALRSVPRSLRDGAVALGANKFETSVKVVLPAGLSGVIASFLLAIARAIGETMAVSLACGEQSRIMLDPTKGALTMTSFIVNIAKGDAPHGTTDYNSLFAVASMLFLITLFMNIMAQRVLRRYRQVYQ